MKKEGSALTSGSGRSIEIIILILMCWSAVWGEPLQKFKIAEIYFRVNHQLGHKRAAEYEALLSFKRGDSFSYKKIRKSMENLYQTDSFETMETRIEKLPDSRLNIYFDISPRYLVDAVKIKGSVGIKSRSLIDAIYSLRKNTYFEEGNIARARQEIRNFLESRGYFNGEIEHRIIKNEKDSTIDVTFIIKTGTQARVNRVILTLPDRKLLDQIGGYFKDELYLPYKLQDKIEKIRKILKKKKYYFPEIEITHDFLDETKTSVNLEVTIRPGFKYIFIFQGIKEREELISSLWEKKRFEKWAEKESRARILYNLRNRGYLNAEVESKIEVKGATRYLTFTVKKNKKYTLGKINFTGNHSMADRQLKEIIKTDDQIFDRLFWLRASSLIVDLGVLRQFYHFKGFPLSEVFMEFSFRKRKSDITFVIQEGKKFTVDSILFEGNQFLPEEELNSFFKTKPNNAFVQQVLNQDIENLKRIYHTYGFDRVEITPEISPGQEKSILIRIHEGKSFRQGNLIIIGASSSQRRLLEKLFPFEKNSPFNRDKLEVFKEEIEDSTIFNEVKISYINKSPNQVDVLIKVIPDRGKYFGFGIGWEDRKGLRGTLEYQGRNIFRSFSSLSAMIQVGFKERRGLLSYDTPYFFRKKINSSFKTWVDNEVYPSYEFNRYGFGESLIRKLTPNSYMLASLSWYRTELTELKTSEHGVDKLDVPFDTTAFNLSYVRERRDDPFNPTSGDYFSSDIKIGFPLFEKDYSFIKFLWSYQRNFRFLKYGTLAFSARNGFASGDMSITERFFAGGVHSFRGTRNDYLSPIDPETGKPMGGNALILFNFEGTFPLMIVPVKDLYYSLFFDIGNVFEKVNDFDLARLERAVGFSIKLKTRMGPLRVDFGWNLRERPEGRFEWNIGIGNVF